MTKLQNLPLNAELPMPIGETVHDLLIACGYRLVSQSLMMLKYIGESKKLLFLPGTFTYSMFWDVEEDDRAPEWSIMAQIHTQFALSSEQVTGMLQSLGAIDYTKLQEYQHHLLESIKNGDDKVSTGHGGHASSGNRLLEPANGSGNTILPKETPRVSATA